MSSLLANETNVTLIFFNVQPLSTEIVRVPVTSHSTCRLVVGNSKSTRFSFYRTLNSKRCKQKWGLLRERGPVGCSSASRNRQEAPPTSRQCTSACRKFQQALGLPSAKYSFREVHSHLRGYFCAHLWRLCYICECKQFFS